MKSDYLPNDDDILRSRKKTNDVQRIDFELKVPLSIGGGTQIFWMYDVGGQRGERKKWIQVFDGIAAVLFVVSSSDFDLKLQEDNKTNRMEESLRLFEAVWSSRFLKQAGFVLFLKKQDLLKEKVEKAVCLEDYFPDYKEYKKTNCSTPQDEYKHARSFIKNKFISITKIPLEDENSYITKNRKKDPQINS